MTTSEVLKSEIAAVLGKYFANVPMRPEDGFRVVDELAAITTSRLERVEEALRMVLDDPMTDMPKSVAERAAAALRADNERGEGRVKVAFDVDDTLWKVVGEFPKFYQAPDYDIIPMLIWFYENGHDVYVWSAGGVDYAVNIVRMLGLDGMVRVVPKNSDLRPDLTFDDQAIELGKVNVRVKRPVREYDDDTCPRCRGTGSIPEKPAGRYMDQCPICEGTGKLPPPDHRIGGEGKQG